MNLSGQPISFRAAADGGWSALLGRVALASLIASSLLALGAIAVPGHAHAAGGDPKIVFASPIYAGQNNGFAEGPVGTNVTVQGSGWTIGGGKVTITLADEQNDTSGQPGSACQNGSVTVSIPGLSSQPVDGSGNFMAAFEWPGGAGQKGHAYWACGTQDGAKAAGVDKFSVLSSNRPTVLITVSQATPGSNIAVTGQNWLPIGVKVVVIVAPCVACGPPYSSNATVTSSSGGTFNVLVQVPPSAPIGTTLYVSAQNTDTDNPPNSGALSTGTSTAAQFTVTSDETPTVTATATDTPTVTSTAAATSTVTTGDTGGNNNNNTNNASGNTMLVVLLGALGAVLLLGAVIAIALYVRSRGPSGPPPYGGGGGYGPKGGQYNRSSRPYGPPSYPNTNDDYYDPPPQRSGPPRQNWRNAGGWQDDYPGPDDDMGNDPTVGMPNPWRR